MVILYGVIILYVLPITACEQQISSLHLILVGDRHEALFGCDVDESVIVGDRALGTRLVFRISLTTIFDNLSPIFETAFEQVLLGKFISLLVDSETEVLILLRMDRHGGIREPRFEVKCIVTLVFFILLGIVVAFRVKIKSFLNLLKIPFWRHNW